MTRPSILILSLLSLAPIALAQSREKAAPDTQPSTRPSRLSDKLSVTEHQLKLGDKPLKYKATAGYLTVKNDDGKDRANFFFISYEKDRASDEDIAKRPITFVFNGGPGAAAVWLHLGTAGPRRVSLEPDGHAPAPPYKLVDNEYTWLDLTDLVFIDPVGTGYSRPAAGEKGEQFYGLREDVQSVGDFIRVFTTRYERWASPKFLAGESYGTTRAAGLSQFLLDRYGIALNGIVLVSSVLNFQTIRFDDGNDLPYILYVPTYAAAAWYHKKLAPELQKDLAKTVKEAQDFAADDYTVALAQGASLSEARRKEVVAKLARYTSLPADFITRSDLRVGPDKFRKKLLEDSRQIIGRFDARIAGEDPRPTESRPDYDPSLPQYLAVYTSTFNDYVRRDLRFESDLPYEVLSDRVNPWNWGRSGSGYVNVTGDMRNAMISNPHLKVMVCAGYFDLATPHFAADYTVDHLDLSKDLRKNITQTYYTGGHMVYHNHDDLAKLKKDLEAFMKGAL